MRAVPRPQRTDRLAWTTTRRGRLTSAVPAVRVGFSGAATDDLAAADLAGLGPGCVTLSEPGQVVADPITDPFLVRLEPRLLHRMLGCAAVTRRHAWREGRSPHPR